MFRNVHRCQIPEVSIKKVFFFIDTVRHFSPLHFSNFNAFVHPYLKECVTYSFSTLNETQRKPRDLPLMGLTPARRLQAQLKELIDKRQFKQAEVIFQDALNCGQKVDVFHYTLMIKCAGMKGDKQKMLKLVEEMKNLGLKPDTIVYNVIINFLGKRGDIAGMFAQADSMVANGCKKDTKTYSAMIMQLENKGISLKCNLFGRRWLQKESNRTL